MKRRIILGASAVRLSAACEVPAQGPRTHVADCPELLPCAVPGFDELFDVLHFDCPGLRLWCKVRPLSSCLHILDKIPVQDAMPSWAAGNPDKSVVHPKQIDSLTARHNIRYIHKSSNSDQEEDHEDGGKIGPELRSRHLEGWCNE